MTKIRRWTAWVAGMALGASVLMTMPAFAASSTTDPSVRFEATAYGPSLQDNYPYGAVDYFGQPLKQGDIAVDPSVIPLHSCVRVTGYHSPNLPACGFIGEADDEGSAIKGKYIDIFMDASASDVSSFGIQYVQVTVLGKATNTSLSGTAACAVYGSGSSASGSESTSSTRDSTLSRNSSGTPSGGNADQESSNGGQAQSDLDISPLRQSIVNLALSQVGDPYVFKGTSPSGFDCSGLTQWVYAKNGNRIPRTVKPQMAFGTPIKQSQLRPGDLVFFHTYLPGASHVGIYIGKHGNIAHAFVAADNRSGRPFMLVQIVTFLNQTYPARVWETSAEGTPTI